ncbi:hypothetical protein [Lentiprolixibacter aurantiacus]|uniref:Uncharacterized protein n=1 Tax=Lentiprolixibacter aurantiacus TaxID=2993939 RepID=A0AAE3SPF1_9FLAO|nr:hypothetical protein [Lentiprolixibacter aurantiacus]MCX2720540.1 hypothetical protein [Lentiprolixibacter aurantiacus]
MNAQFCKVGASNNERTRNYYGNALEIQIQVFQQKAVAHQGTPLQSFFEGKVEKIRKILERRGA